jgi:hypothetical protein
VAALIGLPVDANASAHVAVWANEREASARTYSPTILNKPICLCPAVSPFLRLNVRGMICMFQNSLGYCGNLEDREKVDFCTTLHTCPI